MAVDHEARAAALRAPRGWLAGLNPVLALCGKGLVLVLVVAAIAEPERFAVAVFALRDAIFINFKWLYLALVSATLVAVVWAAASRHGDLTLGRPGERPEFSYSSWIAMLFGAGMGIGLVFWSIAEPLTHAQGNPLLGHGDSAITTALRLTYFHWGLHPWGVYAAVGLALAYFAHRRGMPLTIRSTLYPLLGARIYGPWGHAIDLLSMLATLFGVATSLGLGVKQINAGLGVLFGWETSLENELLLIAIITGAAVSSVASGLHRGIKWLSNANMAMAAALLLAVLVLGPTRLIVNGFLQSLSDYLGNIVQLSLWSDAEGDSGWQRTWTTFYWGWWIAWAPFVGLFIARISRGRTVREFVTGVLVVPTVITLVWIAVFSGAAFHAEAAGHSIMASVRADVTLALYDTLNAVAGGVAGLLLSALATVLIVSFFVTSSDSATLVINTLMSVGHADPPLAHRVSWGVAEGAVAAILLAVGGLEALRAASISAALPFAVILILILWALVRALQGDSPIALAGRGAGRDAPAVGAPTVDAPTVDAPTVDAHASAVPARH